MEKIHKKYTTKREYTNTIYEFEDTNSGIVLKINGDDCGVSNEDRFIRVLLDDIQHLKSNLDDLIGSVYENVEPQSVLYQIAEYFDDEVIE